MKFGKIISFLLIFLIMTSSLVPSCLADAEEETTTSKPIFDGFMKLIFTMGTSVPGVLWFHQEFIQPSFYTITPQVIDLEYLNETEFEITEVWANGTIKKAAFEPPDTPAGIMQRHIFVGQTFKFELTPPENTTAMWYADFEPDVIEMARDVEAGQEVPYLRTKCRLSLELPSDASYPQGDTTLQVKITRTDIMGNLWVPPKGHPVYGKGFGAFSWVFGAVTNYGKFSGTSEEIIKNVSILVRVNKFHKPSFIPPDPIIINKNEVKSVLVDVENLGSHIDTFNFRVYTDNESDLVLSPPPALTLKPGHTSTVSIGVATPRILRDPGSVHEVTIEMYSVDDPENVFSNSFTITTEGVFIPVYIVFNALFFIILIFIIIIFLRFVRRKLYGKICKKPDKPWKDPKEKEHLNKLKNEDKEKYNEIRQMMDDEYQSSLLWYKHYCAAELKKKKEKAKKDKIKKEKAKEKIKKQEPEPKPKKEKKEEIIEEVEKPKKEKPQILKEKTLDDEEIEEILVNEKIDLEKRRKEQAYLRIKREQEKQKRKLGKLP